MNFKYSIWVLLLIAQHGWCEFTPCPFNEQCLCKKEYGYSEGNQISSITCDSTPLSKLPAFPDIGIEKVQITDSGLKAIEEGAFGNLRTRTLILDRNGIYSISNSTFMQMNKSLEELSLNDNHLTEIPMNALFPLESLRSLRLDGNQISSVVVDWKNLKNTLNELWLSNNNIDSIPLNPEMSLSNLRYLFHIHLANNLLITLERNSLPFSLRTLNASSNFIKDFPEDLLNNLQELTNLNLSDNIIENIPMQKYEGKINLQNLDLSKNVVGMIKKPFSKSVKINKLDLSMNKVISIEKEAFSGLDCRELNLAYNKLSNLEDHTFSGLESTLEYLDLSHNKFIKFPDGLKNLKSLKTFKLANNNLSKLKSSLDFFSGLEKFSVSGNNLGIFPYDSLKSLRSLKNLDLSYNKIADIRKSDFKTWGRSLEKLSLQSNSLFFLENKTFDYVPKLLELSLSFNAIADILPGAFNDFNQLEKLDMSFSLKGYGFPTPILSLKGLNYLALDNTNVNSIPKDITKLENIRTLILDFNRIKEIESSVFDSKAHKFLKDLRLSFNFIHKIESNTFSDLNSLKYISLHHNNIIKISDYAFINLPQNLSIFLSNNRIEEIAKSAFSSLPNLELLDLHKNNLETFDFNIFQNVTRENSPMVLNLSWNRIDTLKVPDYQRAPVYIKILDLSHNKISKIPEKLVEMQTSLKSLDLGYNEISALESQSFYSMVGLESLSVVHNKILEIKNEAFLSLKKLYVLDLSHNHIEDIGAGLFKDLESLRILNLSFNNIRTISISGFDNTKLERLILSNNKISSFSSSAILNIGKTLRLLDLSHNQVDTLDSNFFQYSSKIQELNLCHNNFTSDGLAAFQNGSSLLKLELCGNYFVSVPNYAFKNLTNLKYLNLAGTGLQTFPNLTLPSLENLNVSGNSIKNMTETFLSGFPKLKDLNLSNNKLSEFNRITWISTLTVLDLSHNPIKVLDKPYFFGLYNLRKLNIQYLDNIERIDSGIFMDLGQLTSLKVDYQWKLNLNLSKTLTHLKYLKELSLRFMDSKLSNDLVEELPKKLRTLEITGPNLKTIDDTFFKDQKCIHDLNLRITGTGISQFPKHFFSCFKNKKLSLDLTNNDLKYIGPEILYNTFGDLRRFGTKAYSAGIDLKGNPLVCGCNVKWFADWLRRYLVETMDVNNQPVQSRLKIIESMDHLTCLDKKTNQKFPILTYDLTSDELLCGIVLNFPKVKDNGGAATSIMGSLSLILLSVCLTVKCFTS